VAVPLSHYIYIPASVNRLVASHVPLGTAGMDDAQFSLDLIFERK
jgi:hypothetical protein